MQTVPNHNTLKPMALIIAFSVFIIASCSQDLSNPEELGREFMNRLYNMDFSGAAELCTPDTAAIVLFMEKMIEASSDTGANLELPVPAAEEIQLISSESREGYWHLEFESGGERFILEAILDGEDYKIRLPRSSW